MTDPRKDQNSKPKVWFLADTPFYTILRFRNALSLTTCKHCNEHVFIVLMSVFERIMDTLWRRDLTDRSQCLLGTWVRLFIIEGQWMEDGGSSRNCL